MVRIFAEFWRIIWACRGEQSPCSQNKIGSTSFSISMSGTSLEITQTFTHIGPRHGAVSMRDMNPLTSGRAAVILSRSRPSSKRFYNSDLTVLTFLSFSSQAPELPLIMHQSFLSPPFQSIIRSHPTVFRYNLSHGTVFVYNYQVSTTQLRQMENHNWIN
jgi:hypothetical protein